LLPPYGGGSFGQEVAFLISGFNVGEGVRGQAVASREWRSEKTFAVRRKVGRLPVHRAKEIPKESLGGGSGSSWELIFW